MYNEEEKQKTNNPLENLAAGIKDVGSITRPIHITPHGWEQSFKQLEDNIRSDVPFEGKWQSYIKDYRLIIPEELRELFNGGGVVTVSTEQHLLLFGNRHWSRYNQLLAKAVGLEPVNNEVARHIYSNMHRFYRLNDDGTINLPLELVTYAGLTKDVAIIGLIYHAEIHDRTSYLISEKPETVKTRLARFRKLRFN